MRRFAAKATVTTSMTVIAAIWLVVGCGERPDRAAESLESTTSEGAPASQASLPEENAQPGEDDSSPADESHSEATNADGGSTDQPLQTAIWEAIKSLESGTGDEKRLALSALAGHGPGAAAAIPDLLERLRKTDGQGREFVIDALLKIDPEGEGLANGLLFCLSIGDIQESERVLQALSKLDGQAERAASLLADRLHRQKDLADRPRFIGLIATLGAAAEVALPELSSIKDTVPISESVAAAQAIEKIAAAIEEAARQAVGELDAPVAIRVVGSETFTPKAINDALFGDLVVIEAAHPSAPRAVLKKLVGEKVEGGYRLLGFPHATVKVDVGENGKLVMEVVEGQRYAAGDTVVRGNKAVTTDAIRAEIAKKEEAWKPTEEQDGEKAPPQAHFDANSLKAVNEGVTQAYAEAGNLFPTFKTKVVPREEERMADLVVTVEDEGPICTIGKITVTGCVKNTPDDVIRASGLTLGAKATTGAIATCWERLLDSGRFRMALVGIGEEGRENGTLEIVINTTEYEKVPPLKVPPSSAEASYLRLREWMSRFVRGQEEGDLVIEFKDESMEFKACVSPHEGFIVALGPVPELNGEAPRAFVGEEGLTVLRPSKGTKLSIPSLDSHLVLKLDVTPDRIEDEDVSLGMQFNLSWGGDGDTADEPRESSMAAFATKDGTDFTFKPEEISAELGFLSVRASLHQTAFVGLASRKNTVLREEHGSLVMTEEDDPQTPLLVFDATSGRLQRFNLSSDDREKAVVTVEIGAFEKARAEFAEVAAACREEYEPDDSRGSVVSFAVDLLATEALLEAFIEDELIGGELTAAVIRSQAREIASALSKLFRLSGDDSEAQDAEEEEDEDFHVPPSPEKTRFPRLEMMLAPSAWSMGHVFPPGSWPRAAGRAMAFYGLGKKRYLELDIKTLAEAEDLGLAGCVGLARLANMADPRYAIIFAEKGMRQLSLEGVAKDLRTLLAIEELKESLDGVVATLRTADRDALLRIRPLLPDSTDAALTKTLAILDEQTDAGAETVATELVGVWWEAGLKEWLQSSLAPIYVDYGELAYSKRDIRTAFGAATRALELDPKLASAHVIRSIALGSAGQVEKAIEESDKAIELDPECARAYLVRGQLNSSQNAPAARADLEKAIELDPEGQSGMAAKATLAKMNEEPGAIEEGQQPNQN